MKRISVTDSARVDRVARGTFSIGRLGRCLAIPLLVSCGGCFVHKPALDRRPISETLPEFQEAEAEALSPSPAYWWEAFGDPELDDLVRRALDSNLDLQSLAARIAEAAAVARRTGAPLFPTLDVAGEYAADWIESEPRQETSSLGLLLGWELDLWGRIRSARRAAILDTEAAAEDWLDARVLLSASVAETYFEIREERLQRALLEEQIAANETLLDLTRLRFGQGQASVVDVLQQREQLAATRALVPDVEARAEALEYALDVLLGEAPGSRERIAARPLDAPPS
ncbi:MAG TPA: TolC family protein, partial [Planctomycetota bacterium]|nr:TolC family protein [Planctomycetota bacterium]